MSKDKTPASYEVGYGKPPREHQFPKGKSGNPAGSRGRKRGPSSFTEAMKAALLKKQTVIIDGKRRRMTRFEIMLEGLSGSAMQGDAQERVRGRGASRLLCLT